MKYVPSRIAPAPESVRGLVASSQRIGPMATQALPLTMCGRNAGFRRRYLRYPLCPRRRVLRAQRAAVGVALLQALPVRLYRRLELRGQPQMLGRQQRVAH